MRSRAFRTDIQGMRAIAVLLVVIYHAGVTQLGGGFIGVDVFFVISGFLITTHLVESIEGGRMRFGSFYARRVARLLPAALTVIVLTTVVAVIWFPPLTTPDTLVEAAATAAYVPNMLFAWRGTDYLAGSAPSVFQHFWSLGVEEQFYLVWPLLLVLGYWLFKRSRYAIVITLMIVTVTSFALGVWMTQWRQPWAFFLLPTRAWELGIGGLIAVAVLFVPAVSRPAIWKDVLAWLGVISIVLLGFALTESTPYPSWYAALPTLACAAVILGGSGSGRFGPTALLSLSPMQFFGKISYSLYLVHWPLLIAPQIIVGWDRPLALWITLLLGALSVPIAWLSWRFIEEPGRSPARWWARSPRRSLLSAGTAAALVALIAIPSATALETRPLDSGTAAPAFQLAAAPQGTHYVPTNLAPSLRDAANDNPDIYKDGCHLDYDGSEPRSCQFGDNADAPLVALFGDSHAATWFPALKELADAGEIRLEVQTKSACPSATIRTVRANGVAYAQCDQWRERVIRHLSDNPADLVLLANYTKEQMADSVDWAEALAATIDALPAQTRTAVIQDVPTHVSEPSICLSQHLDDADACAWPESELVDAHAQSEDEAAATATGSTYVKVNEYLCGDLCPAIIGDVLVYRDAHHLTATFSRSMAPFFSQEVARLLTRAEAP